MYNGTPTEVEEKLRTCQVESISVAEKYFRSRSSGSCLISLPTGAGKSGVICCLSQFSKYKNILIVTYRRAVCDQLYKQIKGGFFTKLTDAVKSKSLTIKDVHNNINKESNSGVFCTTFQKLLKINSDEINKICDEFELIIIDEGHSEPSPEWGGVIRKFKAKKIIVTATPYRNDLFSFDIDTEHSYIYTYKNAIEEGIISAPVFSKAKKEELVNVVRDYLNKNSDTLCIVKCDDFKNICEYYNLFKDEFKTLAIHRQFETSPLDENVYNVPSNLSESPYKVLIHQRMLDEGIDLPNAKLLILTYSVRSGKELVQTMGRVVRWYKDKSPLVIDYNECTNVDLWENYQEFDDYLTDKTSLRKFINTLNTASLVEKYLDAFPEMSYFDATYKKKFDFKTFNPSISLKIPLASVCFYYKDKDFNLIDCLDKIYWEFTREGALSKIDGDSGIITSVCFDSSKFLKDTLFFQPSLEFVIIREVDDIVAIYDSRGRKYNKRIELGIRHPVGPDKLFKLISLNEKSKTTQASTRAIQINSQQAESILYVSDRLESTTSTQANGSYAVSTTIGSNLHDDLSVMSSYYLGVGSGRVSDQKERQFTFERFCEWVDDVKTNLEGTNKVSSPFLNSFAQTVDGIPTEKPVACIVDLSSYNGLLKVYCKGKHKKITSNYLFKKYNFGISFFDKTLLPFVINTNGSNLSKMGGAIRSATFLARELDFYVDKSELKTRNQTLTFMLDNEIVNERDIFNNNTMKLIFDNGITYLNGLFYKFTLPTDNARVADEFFSRFVGLQDLLSGGLSEKDEDGLSGASFSPSSIFYLIDQLSNLRTKSVQLSQLGPFYQYIPNVDLILCTDMDTEPADFVLSSRDKLIYVHIKCGAAGRPESSAGSICEVGSQAIKNIHYLISNDKTLQFANLTRLRNPWPKSGGNKQNIELDCRIRLFNGTFNINHDINDVLEKINERRASSLVRKEIWIVVGNGFSLSHFKSQFNPSVVKKSQESMQSYQLIDSWLLQSKSLGIELKFFVSP
ncbi:DEAD/DEAH box helicase [Pectobacterium carotovorum]|uniref:DEAD/DEAH box helicase n=1 Tax=Pectobacterium carotovorum TaxID=554 RepID=UPI000580104C|nr:DEAD/DEAH box helicase family protein [Pectobacterium carotovorum]KHT29581.1 restriction endonuclease subunit R [Pectobacterium carotovorum subsp. carotovorum]